jgi:hypothetical protein
MDAVSGAVNGADMGTNGRLPVPSLDDRRYPDLVEAAIRLRDRYCPEWTSTEPGDPGIALIEIFAYLVDQLVYRLNQVPDRLYSEFLNLVGVQRQPAAVATARVDFLLDAPGQTVRIPAGTPVSTAAGEGGPVEFVTVEQAVARPVSLRWVVDAESFEGAAEGAGKATSTVRGRETAGTWIEMVLAEGGPNSLVRVEVEVDPAGAELEWQCSVAGGWVDADAESVPADRPAVLVDTGPDWAPDGDRYKLRVRPVLPTQARKLTTYTFTVHGVLGAGVSVDVQHASLVPGEELGIGTGRPRQRLRTRRAPVLPDLHRVRVGGSEWKPVKSLVGSVADDRHYELDRNTGEVLFGDGTHGAIPPEEAEITIDYLTGGGTGGNVAAGSVVVLREAIPHVARVHNRWPATGGTDAEPVEGGLARGVHGRLRAADRAREPAGGPGPLRRRARRGPRRGGAAPGRRGGELRLDAARGPGVRRGRGVPRRAARGRRPAGRRAAGVPGRAGGGHDHPDRDWIGCRRARRGGARASRGGAADLPAPGARRPGRAGLALRPAGSRGRAVRRAARRARRGAGRQGAPVPVGSGHRRVGGADRPGRPRAERAVLARASGGPMSELASESMSQGDRERRDRACEGAS